MTSPADARPVVAHGLAVGYRSRAVLSGVDITVEPGESLALVGSNGSGKSTLLRTLAGLLPPVGGSLTVLGGAPGTQPHGLAYLSQFHESGFVLPLRSIDVVRMARFDHRGRFARASALDEELVRDALQRMGVEQLAHRPLRSLSGGQQQRVYLAQVLARRARLLVLDEPTAARPFSRRCTRSANAERRWSRRRTTSARRWCAIGRCCSPVGWWPRDRPTTCSHRSTCCRRSVSGSPASATAW